MTTKKVAPQTGATSEIVREIFTIRRTNYFGAAEVNETFGAGAAEPVRMPPLFTETVLERANRMGLCLVLQTDKMEGGKPLTIQNIHETRKNADFLGGKLLFPDDDWYRRKGEEEPLYFEHTPRPGVFLKGRGIIEGTLGKNFIGESLVGADFAEKLFAKEMPEEYGTAIEDLRTQAEKLEKLCRKDWREAARQCAELPFSQLFREPPVETLYRVWLAQKVNMERLFEGIYTRTNILSRGGDLVDVGDAVPGGARLGVWGPVDAGGDMGFSFSCSGELEPAG